VAAPPPRIVLPGPASLAAPPSELSGAAGRGSRHARSGVVVVGKTGIIAVSSDLAPPASTSSAWRDDSFAAAADGQRHMQLAASTTSLHGTSGVADHGHRRGGHGTRSHTQLSAPAPAPAPVAATVPGGTSVDGRGARAGAPAAPRGASPITMPAAAGTAAAATHDAPSSVAGANSAAGGGGGNSADVERRLHVCVCVCVCVCVVLCFVVAAHVVVVSLSCRWRAVDESLTCR
jgi:hypothetical protein